jgi:endonuclease-3
LSPERKIGPVLSALDERYGPKVRRGGDPLAVLIRGILSQNTSDVNSGRAYESLMAGFGDWEAVAGASRRSIARAIQSGGLADQKARTIQSVMQWLSRRDGYSLDFLGELDSAEVEQRLTAIKGVGIKTARLVLLFGFGCPVFVVDTHVLRVSRRIGLIPPRCTRRKAHVLLDELVPDERKYSAHMNMIEHGRSTCGARSPDCPACPVSKWCLYVRDALP